MRGSNLCLSSAALILLTVSAQAGQATVREREATRQLNMAQQQSASQPQFGIHDATANAPPAAAPVTAVEVADMSAAPQMAPMALNSLPNPPDKIASAKVVDDKGMVVGAVQRIELDQGGKPTRVEIALLGTSQIVALDSSRLSYDISNNVVTAALDKSQIADLPKG